MPDRRTLQLPFDKGLDRETGLTAVEPGAVEDLRNVIIGEGHYTVRPGIEQKLTFTDTNDVEVTDILAIESLRGERSGIVVAYQGESTAADYGKVFVYRINARATEQTIIEDTAANPEWFKQADPDQQGVPVVSTAEVFGRVFLAHAQESLPQRAATYVYNPLAVDQLSPLRANLDRDDSTGPATGDDKGKEKIKFFGVTRHLVYLVGWGFGNGKEQNRPEMLRLSKPTNPLEFLPEDYAVAGNLQDPIIACAPSAGGLQVFKETETYVLRGESWQNFGVFRSEPRFGCLGPRLTVTVAGRVFYWSSEGPRMTEGPGSTDLALPLALDAAEPSDLVARTAFEDGFAEYIPEQKSVLFQFGKRAYVLSLRNPSRPRWSYFELGFQPRSAGTLYATGPDITVVPTGHPDIIDSSVSDDELTANWQNLGNQGDEIVELWRRSVVNFIGPEWTMDADDDADGVVNGFTKVGSLSGEATYSLDSEAQKIALSGSSAAGEAGVYFEETGVSAGDVVRASAEDWTDNIAGAAAGRVRLQALDGGGSELDVAQAEFSHGTINEGQRTYVELTLPANTDRVRVTFEVVAKNANESIDAWFRHALIHKEAPAGDWSLEEATKSLFGQQAEVLPGLAVGNFYEFALRYRRGTNYTVGYESSDPNDWPGVSKGVNERTIAAPKDIEASWHRVAEGTEDVDGTSIDEVTVTTKEIVIVTVTRSADSTKVEVRRDGTLIKTFAEDEVAATVNGESVVVFIDEGFTGEQSTTYSAREVADNAESQDVSTTIWTGPDAPRLENLESGVNDKYTVYSEFQADAPDVIEVWDNYDGAGGTAGSLSKRTEFSGSKSHQVELASGEPSGVTIDVLLKYRTFLGGESDLSDESNTLSVAVT